MKAEVLRKKPTKNTGPKGVIMSFLVDEYEDCSVEFKKGLREGLNISVETIKEYIQELKSDKRANECTWVAVAIDRIEDELSMLFVGDEGDNDQ